MQVASCKRSVLTAVRRRFAAVLLLGLAAPVVVAAEGGPDRIDG